MTDALPPPFDLLFRKNSPNSVSTFLEQQRSSSSLISIFQPSKVASFLVCFVGSCWKVCFQTFHHLGGGPESRQPHQAGSPGMWGLQTCSRPGTASVLKESLRLLSILCLLAIFITTLPSLFFLLFTVLPLP